MVVLDEIEKAHGEVAPAQHQTPNPPGVVKNGNLRRGGRRRGVGPVGRRSAEVLGKRAAAGRGGLVP